MNFTQKQKTKKDIKSFMKVNVEYVDYIEEYLKKALDPDEQFKNNMMLLNKHLLNTNLIFQSMLDGLEKKR